MLPEKVPSHRKYLLNGNRVTILSNKENMVLIFIY